MSSSPEFVYGYGRTKHIYGWSETASNIFGKGTVEHRFGLCGAAGGYPHVEPDRPTCKRCLSKLQNLAAGIAASVPTAQEPTPTPVDAPGADSEALAALLDQIACAIRDEWEPGSRIEWAEQHARSALGAVLGSSWLADHDRQTAERVWAECLQAITWATNNGPDPIEYVAANNPYSEEICHG